MFTPRAISERRSRCQPGTGHGPAEVGDTTAAYVPVWLVKPLTLLDDERPIEAIARGQYRAVSRMVAQLENDTTAMLQRQP